MSNAQNNTERDAREILLNAAEHVGLTSTDEDAFNLLCDLADTIGE